MRHLVDDEIGSNEGTSDQSMKEPFREIATHPVTAIIGSGLLDKTRDQLSVSRILWESRPAIAGALL